LTRGACAAADSGTFPGHRPKPRRRASFPARQPGRSVPIATAAPVPFRPRGTPPGTAQARSRRVQRLFRRYHRFGDLAARDELFERFLPLAHGLARRYQRGAEPHDDLAQVASIALLGAIDRFDPERGREFTTFAVPTIAGELKRHYRDHCWAMKVSRGDKDRAVALNRCIDQLSTRLGRPPTPAELAAHTGFTLAQVHAALEVTAAAWPSSLDEPTSPGDDEPTTIAETLVFDDPTLEAVERRDLVARSVRGLEPRERRVLYLRFVEDLTQAEIGQRIGLSQMQVSRILHAALEHAAGE
jgi:RNA polymerase sigma-B factor